MTITRDPNCACGGYGVRWYQDPDTAEVTEEPCLCIDPKTPVLTPPRPFKDAWQEQEEAARKWEALGLGKWDPRTGGEE